MTLGDIFEKTRHLLCGGESSKVRKLRERVDAVKERIRAMEDDCHAQRKRGLAQDEKIEDLKRELRMEKNVHSQDLLMDEIEREEKEAGRIHELANIKGQNLDAARTLRAKLEQLLESTINGGSSTELEDVLSQVECMDDEMSDVRKLVERLEKPTKVARTKRPATKSRTAETERAARRARILGEDAGAPSGKPKKTVPEAKATTDAPPTSTESASASTEPGTVAAG